VQDKKVFEDRTVRYIGSATKTAATSTKVAPNGNRVSAAGDARPPQDYFQILAKNYLRVFFSFLPAIGSAPPVLGVAPFCVLNKD
jgi:hypothetical protein